MQIFDASKSYKIQIKILFLLFSLLICRCLFIHCQYIFFPLMFTISITRCGECITIEPDNYNLYTRQKTKRNGSKLGFFTLDARNDAANEKEFLSLAELPWGYYDLVFPVS